MTEQARLAEIKAREELRRSNWAEDFGDAMHRCRYCGDEETIWDSISHKPDCPIKDAWDQRTADIDWLVGMVERLAK